MRQRSLIYQVGIAFLIVLLPVVALLFTSTAIGGQEILNQVTMANSNLLSNHMDQIDDSLSLIDQWLYNTVSNSYSVVIPQSKVLDGKKYIYALYQINQNLTRDSQLYPYVDALFLYDKKHNKLYPTPMTTGESVDVNAENYLNMLAQQGSDISWTVSDTNPRVLVRMIELRQGVYIGAYLRASNLMPLATQFAENSLIAVLDQENRLIAGNIKVSTMKQSIAEDGPNRAVDSSGSNYMLLGAASRIAPLSLGLAIPEESMLSSITNLESLNLVTVVCVIIVTLLYALMLRHSVLRPVGQILSAMGSFAKGNWDTRIEGKQAGEFRQIAHSFNDMAQDLYTLKISVYDEKIRAQEAEYKQMQMQINPHFYMNVLNAIYNMASLGDTENVKKMALYLSSHFKFSIDSSHQLVSLEEEMSHTKNFLEINRLRFGDSLNYQIDLPAQARMYSIPALTVQTFVENSIKHGFTQRDKPFHISVSVSADDEAFPGCYEIWIKDSGSGFTREYLSQVNHEDYLKTSDEHIGIRNTVSRLTIRYGGAARIEFLNGPEGGAQIRLMLPISV